MVHPNRVIPPYTYDDTVRKDVISNVSPTVDDDVTEGFLPFSRWIDETTNQAWFLVDNTEGAAVWVELTNQGTTYRVERFTDSQFVYDVGSDTSSVLLIGTPTLNNQSNGCLRVSLNGVDDFDFVESVPLVGQFTIQSNTLLIGGDVTTGNGEDIWRLHYIS